MNEEATKKILTLLPRPYEKNPLGGATRAMLQKLVTDQLKAFIHVRKFHVLSPKFKWPKKGKADEVTNGADTLIGLAFNCRLDHLILPMVLLCTNLPQTPPPVLDALTISPPTYHEV